MGMRRLLQLALLGPMMVWVAVACNPIEKEGGTEGQQVYTPAVDGGSSSVPAEIDRPVKLGFNLEDTGDAATFGRSAMKGAEIALEEINDAGGILGYPVEAVFDDNQSMPTPAANIALKLINQDKVDVLIGAVASSQSIAMAKVAEDAGVPMVTPASTKPSVTLNDDGTVRRYVFRTCFTDDFQAELIADFAVTGPIQARRAVIFYDAENDYSVGIYDTIKRVAPGLGLEIVAEDAYLKSQEADFRAKLNKFKAHEFDVLIVPGYYNSVGMIANQAREVGITQPLLGGDGFDSPELYRVAGRSIVGSYFTNHYAADDMDPAVQNYIRTYREHHGGNVPDAMSILTYDAVYVVADAIRRAGSVDHDAVAQALAEVKDFKGAAGSITIDEFHNATKKLVVLEIGEGGQFQWVHTYDPLAGDEIAPAMAEDEMPAEDDMTAEMEDETAEDTAADEAPMDGAAEEGGEVSGG